MSGINKVIIMGRLGRDPELRYSQSGKAVCKFVLATSKKWSDKQTNELREKTEWHRATAWGRAGEVINEYCKKGHLLYIEGELSTSQYEKEGQKHFSTEIMVDEFHLLPNGGRDASSGTPGTPAQKPAQKPAPVEDTSAMDDAFNSAPQDDDFPF
jgi:single-strand DNA-binding protein